MSEPELEKEAVAPVVAVEVQEEGLFAEAKIAGLQAGEGRLWVHTLLRPAILAARCGRARSTIQ